MVATAVVPEVHGVTLAGVGDPLSCEVPFAHRVKFPEIVGLPFTVTVTVAVQPRLFV